MIGRSICFSLYPYRFLKDIDPYSPASVAVTYTPALQRTVPAVFPVSPAGTANSWANETVFFVTGAEEELV